MGAWIEAIASLSPTSATAPTASSTGSPCSTPTPSSAPVTSTATVDDVNTITARATVHLNHATLLLVMGKTKEGNEHLSEAVKILSTSDNDARLQPLLGCILRRIGGLHMAGLQAVTAEGLFNSSVSKLSSAWGKQNSVYMYEEGLCKGQYGHLLKRWEKREERGEILVKEAKGLVQGAGRFGQGVVLSPLVLLP